jgi:protoheme IX farnesyltransferase
MSRVDAIVRGAGMPGWEGVTEAVASWRRAAGDYAELTKARLSGLVLMTTVVGFWMGSRRPELGAALAPLVLGMALVVGGANALNQWMERDVDARMSRTRHRPLPAGRMCSATALGVGLGLSAAGLAILATGVNSLSAALAAVAWISYVLVYTPMKRRTPLCTLVGAVPGALPPVIGWAGATRALGPEAWALFAILFLWQLPHFLALAVLYRDDYAKAGLPMLASIEPAGGMAARQMALYGMALVPASLFPTALGMADATYGYGAAALGLGFVAIIARAAWRRSRQAARQLFLASVLYLPLLLGWLACHRRPL